MTLRGAMRMGRSNYRPGEFRFNAGGKAYPSDNLALGPEGGWAMIFFADRRGTEIRPVVPKPSQETLNSMAQEKVLAEWGGLRVDESDECGESCLITTLGELNNAGGLEGAFADPDSWRKGADGRAAVSAVLNDATRGPLFVFSSAPPGVECIPSGGIATEVVRVIVDGSCTIGDTDYSCGDVRLEETNITPETAKAGPRGVKEVLIFGDRHGVFTTSAMSTWPQLIEDDVNALRAKLESRVTAA
jgi:hypothetical protein